MILFCSQNKIIGNRRLNIQPLLEVILTAWVDKLTVVKVAALKCGNNGFSGGNVCCQKGVVHVAKAQKVLLNCEMPVII